MIGNDIVDLQAAARESNWKRKGFLEKIFTDYEKENILNSNDPEILIWLFWSMKEAAYKANQRKFHLAPSYFPKSFSCKIKFKDHISASGEVLVKDLSYFTKTSISPLFIHTSAVINPSEEIKTGIFENPTEAKKNLIRLVSEEKNISEEYIEIIKDEYSIPHFNLQNKELLPSFSLSHHGNFSAFACELRIN